MTVEICTKILKKNLGQVSQKRLCYRSRNPDYSLQVPAQPSLLFWLLKQVNICFIYTFVLHVRNKFISILQFCFKISNLHHTAGCEQSYQNLSTPEIPYLFHNIPQWVKVKPSVLCKKAFKSIFYLAFKTKNTRFRIRCIPRKS